jgi:signal transduction histidine kinase
MRVNWKDIAALTVAAVALLASLMAASRLGTQAVAYSSDAGLMLGYEDGQVVVIAVASQGAGAADGIVPGYVVAELNGQSVLLMSAESKQTIATTSAWIDSIWLVDRADISTATALMTGTYAGDIFPGQHYSFHSANYGPSVDMWPVALGLLILASGWWLLGGGRAGETLRTYAVTLPVATAMPLLLAPLDSYSSDYAVVAEAVLLVAGTLPLSFAFASALPKMRERMVVRLAALVLGVAAFGFGVIWLVVYSFGLWAPFIDRYTIYAQFLPSPTYARFGALALMSLLPGVLAARPVALIRPSRNPGSSETAGLTATDHPHRFVQSADLALAALTPPIAAMSSLSADHQTWPIVLWLVGLFVARRFGIQPLVRLAQRTSRQRDLVVSATERERARIAADIHDYALQDLTMLVRRLDAAGDVENAAATREVAERLRAICGDLRLPVLDDLGVGPALEWLCGRVEQGGQRVSLDRLDDEKRLPAEAELAFFRVAQEAINNAARHGAPPVRVRYRGGGSWAELEVDDCGAGVPAGAAEAAERTGHLGLMNMTQRAEAIGAELSVGRRPGGGTRVRLVWEGAAEPASGAAKTVGRAAEAVEPGAEPAAEPA